MTAISLDQTDRHSVRQHLIDDECWTDEQVDEFLASVPDMDLATFEAWDAAICRFTGLLEDTTIDVAVTSTTRRTLTVTLDLEGAAFDGFAEQEVAMILRAAATRIENQSIAIDGERSYPLMDSNGNTVGTVATSETTPLIKLTEIR